MKQFYFKSVFLSLLMIVVGMGYAFAEDKWVKTAPADLVTGDVVMIVDLNSDRAMSNDNGTSAAPDAIRVYYADDDKTESTGISNSTFPETLQWVVNVDESGYKFGVSGTDNFLYCTNTNNGVRVGTNSNNIFVMQEADANSTEDFLFNKGTSRYIGVYQSADWRCYTTVNNNIKSTVTAFYKKVEDSTPSDATLTGISLSGYTEEFNVGDEFSFGGTVTAVYDDESTKTVTSKAEFSEPDMTTAGTKVVTVSYTEGEVTKTATYNITVSEVAMTGISLNLTETTLLVGKTRELDASIEPENATNKNVTWSSSDESVATVADGVVTAVAAGTAVITVSSASVDGISATCTVTVVDELNEATATGNLNNTDSGVFAGEEGFSGSANSVSGTLATDAGNVVIDYAGSPYSYLNQNEIRMYKSNATLKLTAPTGYEFTEIVFTGTDIGNLIADVGTYENKKWTGTESLVTFTSSQSGKNLKTVTVTLSKASEKSELVSILVENPKTEFGVGDDFVFEGTVTANYANQTTKDVTSQAEFSEPDMSQAGEQTVTVSYTEDEITKTAEYTITVSPVAATGVSINPSEATLLVGNTRTLTAVFEPENATDKTVTWSSSNESVATVADGVVTAVAAGTAVITVSSASVDGISATCTVTVVDELNETTATGNLNNSDSGVFAGVDGFTGGGHSVSGTLITDAGNVAVTYAGTTNTYLCDSHIRMYSSGSTLKFTAPSGFDLTKIVLTISAGNADNIYADEGTYTKTEDKVATWTGAETAVTFKGKMTTTRLAIAEVTLEKAAPKPSLVSIALDGATTDFIVNSEFVFGGTVTATYEDQTTKDVTAKATFSEPDMTTAGTQEVTVSYTEDEVTKTATYSITVREPETVTFRKVSSTDELVAGKRYVLVNEGTNVVMAACSAPSSNTSVYDKFDTTISNERLTLEENQANILTLGGEEGAWTFATSIEPGKYLAYTGSGNYLESGNSAETASAQWTITFDEDGNALIKSNNIEGRYINYNSSQPRFATYKSTDTNPYGTQKMIQLYMEADEVDVTISQVGYATLYYSDRALKLPAGVTAKTYTVAGGKLVESKTYEAGKVIPAGEAVVLKGAAGDYKFMVTTTSDEPDAGSMLKGTDEAVETEGGNFYYALQAKKKDGTGGPGFYWMNSTGAAFTNGAHKAYMALDKKFADAQEVGGAKSFYLFEEATGIRSAWTDGEAGREQHYNLSGQRVGNGYKGIVIVNGKKIVIK